MIHRNSSGEGTAAHIISYPITVLGGVILSLSFPFSSFLSEFVCDHQVRVSLSGQIRFNVGQNQI